MVILDKEEESKGRHRRGKEVPINGDCAKHLRKGPLMEFIETERAIALAMLHCGPMLSHRTMGKNGRKMICDFYIRKVQLFSRLL